MGLWDDRRQLAHLGKSCMQLPMSKPVLVVNNTGIAVLSLQSDGWLNTSGLPPPSDIICMHTTS